MARVSEVVCKAIEDGGWSMSNVGIESLETINGYDRKHLGTEPRATHLSTPHWHEETSENAWEKAKDNGRESSVIFNQTCLNNNSLP